MIANSNGDKMHPCRTPVTTSDQSLHTLFNLTQLLLPLYTRRFFSSSCVAVAFENLTRCRHRKNCDASTYQSNNFGVSLERFKPSTPGSMRRPLHGSRTPNRPRSFCSEYILWRQQWTATAAEQRPDTATSALSSCSSVVSKRLASDDHPRNVARITTSESEL